MSTTIVSGHITANATQKQVNTANGIRYVTTFTVADNANPNRAEFFRFSAWSSQPSKLATYARQGRAVTCIGEGVKVSAYTDRNGKPAGSLDLTLTNITWMDAFAGRQAEAAPVPEVAVPDTVPVEQPVTLPF